MLQHGNQTSCENATKVFQKNSNGDSEPNKELLKALKTDLHPQNCSKYEESQIEEAFKFKKMYGRVYRRFFPHFDIINWFKNMKNLGLSLVSIPNYTIFGCHECHKCDLVFSDKESLQKHQNQHPQVDTNQKHECQYCSYSTCYSSHLQYHLLTHSCEQSFTCTKCQQTFGTRSQYQRHQRSVHTKEKPYVCDACQNSFGNTTNFIRMRKFAHLGMRSFMCSVCGKSFASTNSSDHEKGHNQGTPLKCSLCDLSFKRMHFLRRHIVRAHMHIFPHKCDRCQRGFITAKDLKSHFNIKHALR